MKEIAHGHIILIHILYDVFTIVHCRRSCMNHFFRIVSALLICMVIFTISTEAEKDGVAEFYESDACLQEILKEQFYYESALSFVFCQKTNVDNEVSIDNSFGKDDGKWGFYDKRSGYIQQACYDEIRDAICTDADAPILAKISEKYGYLVRSNGNIAIPFIYDCCGDNSEFVNGYAVVKKQETAEKSYDVLINTSGKEIVFPEGYELTSFVYDDKIVVRLLMENCYFDCDGNYHDDDAFKYGLGTTNGDIVLEPQYGYDYISDFHEGYACVKTDLLWGHIDINGDVVVEPQYILDEEKMGSEGYFFKNGIAELVLLDGRIIYINYEGKEV